MHLDQNSITSGQAAAVGNPDEPRFNVLLADDSENDRFLISSAIRRVPGLRIIGEVSNGTEVIAYLHGLGQFADRNQFPLPDLLLLDLKMPFKDGFEVLKWLRTRRIPNLLVVVLTDSVHTEQVKRALDLGADYYVVKMASSRDRYAMAATFEEYLLKASAKNRVPTRASES